MSSRKVKQTLFENKGVLYNSYEGKYKRKVENKAVAGTEISFTLYV